MLMRKAYRFRLYPTAAQQHQLAREFGCVRWVYNHFLERRQAAHQATGKGLSYTDTTDELAGLKREPGLEWLREAYSQTLQQGLKDLDAAYQRFFSRQNRYPRFKRKHWRQSCRYPQGVKLTGEGRQAWVYLPSPGAATARRGGRHRPRPRTLRHPLGQGKDRHAPLSAQGRTTAETAPKAGVEASQGIERTGTGTAGTRPAA